MLDKFLAFGATFDWITPVSAWALDFVHGGGAIFSIVDSGALTCRAVTRHLRQRGIRTWGEMIVGEEFLFTVPRAEGKRAAALLQGLGVTFY